jgi:nucleoside-diphosphate-sugar epimerase
VEHPTTDVRGSTRNGTHTTLTVAVTGASGTIGPSLLAQLADADDVGQIVAIGRRVTEEMESHAKIIFREADVRDANAVAAAVAGADVVVHLAFSLYGVLLGEHDLFETNVTGTANVARAAVNTGARRFVYTSSAAVYGRGGTPSQPLYEDAAMQAPARLFYARHKSQAELVVHDIVDGTDTELFVFRPCGIIGPHAAGELARRLPIPARRFVRRFATIAAGAQLRPALPAPPVPFQFVHEDDVAQAVAIAARGDGPPGTYNLAGAGVVDGSEALRQLGIRPLPLPRAAVAGSLRVVARLPPLPPALGWPELVREPLILDTTKARDELGWEPRFTTRRALRATRKAIGW